MQAMVDVVDVPMIMLVEGGAVVVEEVDVVLKLVVLMHKLLLVLGMLPALMMLGWSVGDYNHGQGYRPPVHD